MEKIAYLYVFDTMADWEIAFLTAELNTGRFFRKGAPKYTVRTFGLSKNPITSMGGIRILPDCALEDCLPENAGALILPGGTTWHDPLHRPVLEMAGEFLDAGIIVGAICGATEGLARAGLLNTRLHTSNDKGYLKAVVPDYVGDAMYQEEHAVTARNLITASGTAPLEFTYHMLRALDVFTPDALEAWYSLYRTGKPEYFYALMEQVTGPKTDSGN